MAFGGVLPLNGLHRVIEYIKDGLDADGCVVGLFNNTPTLNTSTVLADLREPTYAGYARQACAPWTIAVNTNFGWKLEQFGGVLFTSTQAGPGPERLQGWFVVNGAGVLLVTARFPREPLEPFLGSSRSVFVDIGELNLYPSVA